MSFNILKQARDNIWRIHGSPQTRIIGIPLTKWHTVLAYNKPQLQQSPPKKKNLLNGPVKCKRTKPNPRELDKRY